MTTRTERWVLFLTAMASFMVALDQLVVASALSTIRDDLGASIAQLEWTVNAYSLTFAVLLLPAAAVGDRLGRRRVFAAGLALFAASSAACALAPDVGTLIAARAVQGVGAAMTMPLAFALLAHAVPPERRGKALGLFSAVTGIAVLGGPIVGGAIVDGLAWQWIFWLNVPIGAVIVALVLARVPESRGARVALDVPGLALVGGAAFGLLWGLVRGNGSGWGSAEIVASLVAGALLAAAFVAWELRCTEPMLPMRLFGERPFAAGNAAAFLLYGALFSAVFFLAQFEQVVLGFSPFQAGLGLLVWTGTLFFVAPIAGARVDGGAGRSLVVVGMALQGAGMGAIALLAEPGMAYVTLVVPLVVAGCGVSMAMPAVQAAILGSVTPAEVGKASGTYNTMRQLGGAFGIAVVVAVFAARGDAGSAQAFNDGFGPGLGVTAGLSFAGALAALGPPRRLRVTPGAAVPATTGATA